jgi:hypothetical protein
MMGGETARNMYSIDSNKEYCIALQLVEEYFDDARSHERQTCKKHVVMSRNTISPP